MENKNFIKDKIYIFTLNKFSCGGSRGDYIFFLPEEYETISARKLIIDNGFFGVVLRPTINVLRGINPEDIKNFIQVKIINLSGLPTILVYIHKKCIQKADIVSEEKELLLKLEFNL